MKNRKLKKEKSNPKKWVLTRPRGSSKRRTKSSSRHQSSTKWISKTSRSTLNVLPWNACKKLRGLSMKRNRFRNRSKKGKSNFIVCRTSVLKTSRVSSSSSRSWRMHLSKVSASWALTKTSCTSIRYIRSSKHHLMRSKSWKLNALRFSQIEGRWLLCKKRPRPKS